MTPSRILPDLQCSLLCEEVRQESNGNFFLVGILNFIRVPQLPVTALRLFLFNRWTAGFGQFTETVRLLGPDQTTVVRKSELKFMLQDVVHNTTTINVWGPIKFETAGAHYVEVLVDDVMKLRYPIAIILAPPEQQQQGGAPKREA